MKLNKIIIVLLFLSSILFSQQNDDSLKSLNQRFQSFEYEKVISEADSLLSFKDSLSTDLLLEIYRMKGISHFSLLQDGLAENSFTEILKIDSAYTLDSAKTSPKIISFFNEIKKEYEQQIVEIQKFEARIDTVYITDINEKIRIEENIKNSLLRSIILPGWGHIYSETTTKGIILTSLSVITMVSSVYFIIDCNSKEDDYLNTKDPNLVSEKWDEYNSSYKMRNYSLLAYAAVWIYSQLDLLLFSGITNYDFPESVLSYNASSGFNFSCRFSF